jgi:hypothetical protein
MYVTMHSLACGMSHTLLQVADFVYFCAKAAGQSAARIDIFSVLSDVLFEESVSISQTFKAR